MTEILSFWVDIEDASGNKLGAGRLLPGYFDTTEPLSAAGSFEFSISPADPNIDAVVQERRVVCRYLDPDGNTQTFGGGKIKQINKRRAEDGSISVVVSGPNTLGELRDRIVENLQIGDSTGGDTDGPQQIMAYAPAGWSVTSGTTAEDVYVGFDDQTVLAALVAVSDGIAEHFRLGSGQVVEWLGNYTGFSASGIRAIEHIPRPDLAQGKEEIAIIKQVTEVEDSRDIVTRIYPRGAGNGTAILRLESLVDSPPAGFTVDIANGYIEDDAAVIAYGVIEKAIDFKNIGPLTNAKADKQQAAAQLMRAGVEYLRRWSTPQKFYTVDLLKVDALLKPGVTIRVIYEKTINGYDVLDIDQDLNIISVTNRVDFSGIYTNQISVSTIDTMPVDDQDIIVSQIESEKVFTTHAQLNANARNIDRVGTMDNANALSVAFWFGNEVSSIRSVMLRFKIDPLRSTVKSVAGSSTTTASGGGSTSGSGGASTPTSGTNNANHSHGLSIANGSPTYTLGLDAFGGLISTGGGITNTDIQNNDTNHTHDVTIPNHTHTTPNHTHTLTPVISTVYGIFQESAANTLAVGDLTIKVNGVTFTGSITSIAGGWYEADITDELIDSSFSPDQANNAIEYSTAVAKTAQITTSLAIVDIVQAVSIL